MRRICALATICLLALPAAACADGGQAGHRYATSAELFVQGSNGYVLEVNSERGLVGILATTKGPPKASFGPGEGNLTPGGTNFSATGASFSAEEGNRGFGVYTTKAAVGVAPGQGIAADFGERGEISVVFNPSGEVRVRKFDKGDKAPHCHAPSRIVRRLGTFTGTIRFQGEGGYTTVDAISAPGSVGTSPRRSCTSKVSGPFPHIESSPPQSASLFASSSGTDVSFNANFGVAPGGASFFAMAFESSGEVQVMHVAVARAPKSSFLFADALSSATVKPPPPFSGYGSFHREPESPPSWTGSLSVAFPGLEVPLAGPSFTRAHLLSGIGKPARLR